MKKIGIREEDKYVMERRVPIVPDHVRQLVEAGIKVEVVTSKKRVFSDEAYAEAGAEIVKNLNEAEVVLGVKEIPLNHFQKSKTYIFFSHTIKGQEYNMPLLRKMMEKKDNLIDYECITDEKGRRLIFFGRFAGLAGMINSLWALGQRYAEFGIDTPFLKIQQTHKYHSLQEAKQVISEVGKLIAGKGLERSIDPLIFGITGYGNVSQGAQEILDLLPVKEISPKELLTDYASVRKSGNSIYKVVFREEHLSKPINPDKHFNLQEYYEHPERFEDQFEQYIPYLTVLMNCMYWDDRYPRIVTKDYLENLYKQGNPKLTVIGDITCDPDGSVECTHKGTEIEDPVFVYNPFDRKPAMGFEGEGILVMAVDILPSELPRESSQAFSDALFQYIPEIAGADFNGSLEELGLPAPIRNALILHKGELTPAYAYLEAYLE